MLAECDGPATVQQKGTEAEIGGRRFIRFSTIDRSVLFSDSGRALPSVFTHQKLNFVYHYFFKSQLTFLDSKCKLRLHYNRKFQISSKNY